MKVTKAAAKKNPDNAPISVVMNTIDVRPINRTTQDIPKWRTAVQSAEATTPRRKLLYELYHDVVQDGHVIATMGKRFDAVTGADWKFVNKKGEEVPVINDIIDSVGFEDLVKEILNSKFWGYTICEPKFYKAHEENWEMVANLIPRRHYMVEKGIISYDGISEDGINIREGIYAKTVLEAGDLTDLGLLVSAAQYYVLKRGGIGDYAMFVQVFGRPILDGTWDGVDNEQRLKLIKSLEIGAGGTIIRPAGTELNIIESKGTHSTVHEDFKNAMNAEISKALLGTTETTESSKSSGFAQAETHSTADSKKFKGDITFVRKVLNSRFVKILEAHGFDTQGGYFIVDDEDENTPTETLTIINDLVEKHGLPIDHDFLYEKFNIPKPDNYESILQERKQKTAKIQVDDEEIEEEPNKLKKQKKQKTEPTKKASKNDDTQEAEVKLMSKLKKWLSTKNLLKDFFLNAPAKTGANNGNHHTIKLSFENDFNNDDFIKRIWDAEGNLEFDEPLFKSTLNTLLNAFKYGWETNFVALNNSLGFEYNFNDPAVLTAYELNLFRFTGAKTLAQVYQLNEIFKQSRSFKEFYAKAIEIIDVFNGKWLETEYSTAVLTGESASLYHRLKAQTDIFPYWQYKTAFDEHVRHSHKPLHDMVLPANSEYWDKIFPPNGWNCRCYVVPRAREEVTAEQLKKGVETAKAYINSSSFAKEAAQGWGVNRGKTGEIFTANQQYVNKLPNLANKLLNNLSHEFWGLKNAKVLQAAAKNEMPTFNGTATDWLAKTQTGLLDYGNRKISINASNFKAHTTGKKEVRNTLLDAAYETILKPDEVWVNDYKARLQTNNSSYQFDLNNLMYVKHYKGKSIVVVAELRNLKLELKTWFLLSDKRSISNKFRSGVLIKK